jgi:hypothetical protein
MGVTVFKDARHGLYVRRGLVKKFKVVWTVTKFPAL